MEAHSMTYCKWNCYINVINSSVQFVNIKSIVILFYDKNDLLINHIIM